jgi:antitoxin HicB
MRLGEGVRMKNYPARVLPDGAGYMVSFRDVPEALTSGATKEEAITMAQDALITAMDFYFEDRREVPMPSKRRKGEVEIELPPSVTAKVLLLNEMLRNKVRASDLARRLKTSPQVVQRIVDLKHATKIDTIDEALSAMGKRLQLEVV